MIYQRAGREQKKVIIIKQKEKYIYIYIYIYAISAKCFAPHCTGMLMSMSTYIPVRDRRTKNYLHNRKAPGKCSMKPFRQSCGFEHAGDAGPHQTRCTNFLLSGALTAFGKAGFQQKGTVFITTVSSVAVALIWAWLPSAYI